MRSVRVRRRGLVLLAGLTLAGCARDPIAGRSLREERELGRLAAARVEALLGDAGAPEAARYVSAVGARLVASLARRGLAYRFGVVPLAEPAAFALPGGWIYVSSGLLSRVADEDELAAVLAHEIVHVAERHHAARGTGIRRAASPLEADGRLARAAGAEGALGELVRQLRDATRGPVLPAYAPRHEREADRRGQELAARAGYDPAALPRLLRALASPAERAAEAGAGVPWLDPGADPAERIRRAGSRASALEREAREQVAAGAAFLARLEGLRLGSDPAEGVFRQGRFLHPGLALALALPPGWTARNAAGAVLAVSPDAGAALALEVAGRGDDAVGAARAFARRHGLALSDLRRRPLGDGGAVQARAGLPDPDGGTWILDLTFVSHAGYVLRITGLSPVERYGEARRAFEASIESFRRLSDADRAEVRGRFLTVARAAPGEDLAALSARVGNRWPLSALARINRLPPDASLRAGQRVRVAVERAPAPMPSR